MKVLLIVSIFLTVSIRSYGQEYSLKGDTLRSYKNVMLILDNGSAISHLAVSGDIYLTTELFIFHPKRYRKKRFDMYLDLVKYLILPYDSLILVKRKGFFNLKLKTMSKKYKISYSNNWGKGCKSAIAEIRSHMKKHPLK